MSFQIDLDKIMNMTLDSFDLSKEMLKSRNRNKKISMARRVIILLARNYTEESTVSISKSIGVTKSLVSKINSELLKSDEKLSKVYNEVIKINNSTFQP